MSEKHAKKWYRFVPSLFTTFNVICGSIAIIFALEGKIQTAMILMFIGAFFDFIDGFAARILKTPSEFGKELDSLADMITFGLLPGTMLYFVQKSLLLDITSSFSHFSVLQWIYFSIPILIPVFSALRLAKFNIDSRQTESFIGLPTPANAIFFASFTWILMYLPTGIWEFVKNPLAVSLLIIVFSYLLISEIPLFSLKFKKLKGKDNSVRFIFLLSSVLLLLLFKVEGLPLIVLLYIAMSIIKPLLIKIIYRP